MNWTLSDIESELLTQTCRESGVGDSVEDPSTINAIATLLRGGDR